MRRFLASASAALTVLVAALVAAVASPATPAMALDNGLTLTPPMGFNDWNAFGCNVSEQLIKDTADLFVNTGLKAAGYEYVNIDDCWLTHDRDPSTGRLVPDPVKFPDGIKGTADYVHAKGLKLGIYEDAGTNTCAGYPGSLGHEQTDADTFADWGVDYLKYDNCYNAGSNTQQQYIDRYTAMRDALAEASKRTGRPIVYSLCEWGVFSPSTWAANVGNLWRTTGDINDSYGSMVSIFHQNVGLSQYAGPGHWNDPDMLEVGNGGMSDTEYKSHFSLWAEMAAPLLAGTDLRKATPETMAIYLNTNVIAVDQDKLGVQASIVSSENGHWVLNKPLANGDHAVVLFNETDAPATFGTTAQAIGLDKAPAYDLRDLWQKTTSETTGAIRAAVPPHATMMYRVSRSTDPGAVAPQVTMTLNGIDTAKAGQPTTVTATLTDDGRLSAQNVSVSLNAPTGWTVTPVAPQNAGTVAPGKQASVSWQVVEPQPTKPFNVSTLTATANYTWDDTYPASTTASATAVQSQPVQAPYHTFASISGAQFGQAGNDLGIRAAGADTWFGTDEYGSIYLPGAEHDGSVATVKVTSQSATSDWAKSGIVVRNDITKAGSPAGYLILVTTPGNGYALQWDSNGDGTLDSNINTGGHPAYPSSLKLTRNGTTYTGYYSTDGTTWVLIGSATVPPAAATQDVGVFMTAHNAGSTGEADFSNFTVS
jgi:hypothetical protein